MFPCFLVRLFLSLCPPFAATFHPAKGFKFFLAKGPAKDLAKGLATGLASRACASGESLALLSSESLAHAENNQEVLAAAHRLVHGGWRLASPKRGDNR